MQDVSYEPLMLCPSENLPSKLGYFQSSTPSPLLGSCIHRKAINKDKPSLSTGWYPTSGKTATCKAKWFILVYRLAMDARPWMGDGVAD